MQILVAEITLGLYALLLGLGGWIGYVRAKSYPSLAAGIIGAVVALLGMSLLMAESKAGLMIGAILSGFMLILFGYRLSRGRRFMPAGLMTLASLVTLGLMLWPLVGTWVGG